MVGMVCLNPEMKSALREAPSVHVLVWMDSNPCWVCSPCTMVLTYVCKLFLTASYHSVTALPSAYWGNTTCPSTPRCIGKDGKILLACPCPLPLFEQMSAMPDIYEGVSFLLTYDSITEDFHDHFV